MTTSDPKVSGHQPEPVLDTGAVTPMSAEQEQELRELAKDALEPEAFSRRLTQAEADERSTCSRPN